MYLQQDRFSTQDPGARKVTKTGSLFFIHTDGEAVIMLAFQASGRGSTPLQCTEKLERFFLV